MHGKNRYSTNFATVIVNIKIGSSIYESYVQINKWPSEMNLELWIGESSAYEWSFTFLPSYLLP